MDDSARAAPARRPATVELAGATVLVTGASLGIGREIAFGFAAAHSRLALTYLEHEAEARSVAARCRELGAADVHLVPLDLGDETSIRACAATVIDAFGRLDVLVNNAGVVVWRPFLEQSFSEIDLQVLVNLQGTMKLTWLLLPQVRDAIITIASTASLHGTSALAPYCASKWGVRGFVKALAREHPEKRIVAVHPTVTATRMNDFKGMAPERVAEVVLMVARGEFELQPGADVDVRELAEGE